MEYKFKHYINKEFKEQQALVEVTNRAENIILTGDYYHDKIAQQISGFLLGVQWSGEDSYEVEVEEISEEHDVYYSCDFCAD